MYLKILFNHGNKQNYKCTNLRLIWDIITEEYNKTKCMYVYIKN